MHYYRFFHFSPKISCQIANYLRDDEAEPDDEDDAEGEGDCGEPAGQPHAQVQAAHPLGPGAARGKEAEDN